MWTLLGIPNCDTVKRARKYLESQDKEYVFRDIRKEPLSAEEWGKLVDEDHQNRLVNTRSPSFRKSGFDKTQLSDAEAVVKLLQETPTAMKRPVVLWEDKLSGIGFDPTLFDS